MRICYIDESGDTGTLQSAASPVQPVLVIVSAVVEYSYLKSLTQGYINLKQRFSPHFASKSTHRLGMILKEMKGSEIRKDVVSPSRRESRRAIGFLDRFLDLIEYHKVRIFGRVWIKQIGHQMDADAVFTSSIQKICHCFQEHLCQVKDTGFVIADSRSPGQNSPVAHSIFTQKYRIAGDPFDRIWEMPTFGHSCNHVGIQVADILASALLFPISAFTYCSGYVTSPVHVKPGHGILRDRYGERLKKLQFRYKDGTGKWTGGITVSDSLGKRSGALLFQEATPAIITTPSAVAIVIPPSTVETTTTISSSIAPIPPKMK